MVGQESAFATRNRIAVEMSTDPLIIRLFGPLQVLVHGEPIPRLRTRSVEWLLALLILRSGKNVSRSWLAGTLWPDSEESQALQNLRNALLSLRQALGIEASRIESPTRDTLTLNLEGAEVDQLRFDQAIRQGDEAALREAVSLYMGPLLEGCLEEWALPERDSRQQAYLNAIEALGEIAENQGDFQEAEALLRRAEGIDSLRDTTQRGLMRVLAATGDTPAALFVYREYRLRLRREMNVEPDAETTALYQRIRIQGPQTAAPRAPSTEPNRASTEPSTLPVATPDQPTTVPSVVPAVRAAPLPHPLTALIGREQAIQEVSELVSTSRLVTLVGGGGVGKTRLSIQVAAEAKPNFRDGIAFVALASLADPAMLAAFVASSLGIREEASDEPEFMQHALTGWLSTRSILLVLDNCEHLVAAAASLAQALLERCPGLHILATSRQRLGLIGEVAWRVPSLPGPDAVQLFLDRAAMARPGFNLRSDEEKEAVAEICRQVDGIPLAIELAAARMEMLSVGQIASKLEGRFRLLTGSGHGVMPRHQTIRALIDWSYELLSEEEETLFRRLAVFSGGWTLEAISDFGLRTSDLWDVLDVLSSLINKSLVQAEEGSEGTRYRMLEMVREYALDKLREQSEEDAARRYHLLYFLSLARETTRDLGTTGAESSMLQLEAEVSNFRTALSWSQAADSGAYLELCAVLWPFWETCGHLTEGRAHLGIALNLPEPTGSQYRSQALLGAARLAIFQHHLDEATRFGQECLDQFRQECDDRGSAAALICLGEARSADGAFNRANELLEEGRELSLRCHWRQGAAFATLHLGKIALFQNDLARARRLMEEGITFAEGLGDRQMLATAYHNLGLLAVEEADIPRAQTMMEKSLDLYQRMGDKLGTARTIGCLGLIERNRDAGRAKEYCRLEAAIFRELGNPAGVGLALHGLGCIHYEHGEYGEARKAFKETLDLLATLKTERSYPFVRVNLGSTLFHLGELFEAKRHFRKSLEEYVSARNEEGIIWSLERIGVAEAAEGDPARAARIMASASRLRDGLGLPLARWDQEDWDHAIVTLRGALCDPDAFDSAWREGRTITVRQAIELALHMPADRST